MAKQLKRRRTADRNHERSVSRALAQVSAAATRGPLRGGDIAGTDRYDRRPWQLAGALRFHQVREREFQLLQASRAFLWNCNMEAYCFVGIRNNQGQVYNSIGLKVKRTALNFKPKYGINLMQLFLACLLSTLLLNSTLRIVFSAAANS